MMRYYPTTDKKVHRQAQDLKVAKRTTGGETQPSKMPEINVPVLPGLQVKSFQDLLSECNKDHISKSLLHMQKALQLGCHANPTDEQKTLLEEAAKQLKQAEGEEKYLFIENTVEETTDMAGVEKTRVPPPPILLSRTDTKMVFRPASFNPSSGAKVAWYRIFARQATGANVKVRLNDYFLPGSGQPVPSFRCELSVSGLTPRERYMFAVAAFSADGKLIGGMVGDSTKAILASHPMPILMAWSYLSQTAYQVGYLHAVAESSLVLWRHFVAQPPPPEEVVYVTSVERDFKLTLLRLNKVIVTQTSPVLLRMFLASIFAYVDVRVKQGQLFCDRLSDHGPLYPGQIKRLRLCERMLVAMELSGWLNESSLALQAVIQSYGLLAPLIHYKIPVVPVMQVLERCLIVLQEIPPSQRKRRSQTITEGLHHMIACLTYHLAKVLRMWNQKALAGHINEAGRKMLSVDMDKETEEDAFPGIDKARRTMVQWLRRTRRTRRREAQVRQRQPRERR
ncbi:hypothetical protein NP493_340g02072 [Ridgeia piscesae]|uniref:Uncharacterized protein n=1 Tax=Ridgeia piscesae TaxID=27915 RepID=A0AAD9NVM7_RIDPI|nr:hypothetical protein NP493_340g02072 [Ridgeia piscesae]